MEASIWSARIARLAQLVLDVKNLEIIHTPPTFFIPSGWSEQAGEGKKGHVKPPKKIDQDLGFVPLITA